MMNLARKTILFCTLSLFASATLCGCRFGNYSDPYLPIPQPAPYKVTNLYNAHAEGLSARVYTSTNVSDDSITPTYTENTNVPLHWMPDFVLNTLSTPLYYLVPTDKSKSPMFAALDLTSEFTTGALSGNTISYSAADAGYYRFMNSTICGSAMQITHAGIVDTSHPSTYKFSDGTTSPIQGNLSLTLTYTTWFWGDCTTAFNTLAACYNNGNGCSSDLLKLATETFGLYVNAGLINLQNQTPSFSQIKGLEFTAQYGN